MKISPLQLIFFIEVWRISRECLFFPTHHKTVYLFTILQARHVFLWKRVKNNSIAKKICRGQISKKARLFAEAKYVNLWNDLAFFNFNVSLIRDYRQCPPFNPQLIFSMKLNPIILSKQSFNDPETFLTMFRNVQLGIWMK